jgi:hypothetical protein
MDRTSPEMTVSFTATNMPVATLAELFEFLFPGQIMVPASRVRALFTTKEPIRDVQLGDLVDQIGLLTAKKPLEGRSFTD